MIELTRKKLFTYNHGELELSGLEIQATSEDEEKLPDEIFVMQYYPPSEFFEDRFVDVASLKLIKDLPIETAIIQGGEQVPFYLTSKIKFLRYTPAEVNQLWEDIKTAVTELVKDVKRADELSTEQKITIT